MNPLNLLFTLSSLNVLLVTIERFSPTTKILLQPYNFLRLHELFQMSVVILLTVIIPFLLLKVVSNNFQAVKAKAGFILAIIFIVGIYFYATGNGVHELASFTFNQYCDVNNFSGDFCNGSFFNDYYTGNILYFLGAALMIGSVILLEIQNPNKSYSKKDLLVSIVNSVVYSLALIAYAAFDRVLVGLVYTLMVMIFADLIFLRIKKRYLNYPVTTYTALTYTLGGLISLFIRFH